MRLLTSIVTGLCAVPLCGFAGYLLVAKMLQNSRGQGGDMTGVAIGGLGIVAGFVCAVVGFAAAFWVAGRLVPPDRLLYLQIADGVLILAMAIGAVSWNVKNAEPGPLEYYGREVLLELELRAPESHLKGEKLDALTATTLLGGQGATVTHAENSRVEGDSAIFPVTIHLIQVKEWAIRVALRQTANQAALFVLDLPLRPEKSTEWSGWIQPVARDEYQMVDWLTMRYRFRLVPRPWYKEGATTTGG